jgi:hypothetical protein
MVSVHIKKNNNQSKFYKLENKYIETGLLKTPNRVHDVIFGDTTPVLGKEIEDDAAERETVEELLERLNAIE